MREGSDRADKLRHPALTQQHHLDALTLRDRYLLSQRSFQPPHLGFAAFDHLFAPNQMAQTNHTSGRRRSFRTCCRPSFAQSPKGEAIREMPARQGT